MWNFSVNFKSAAFWTALSGAAGLVCGALGVGGLTQPISEILTGIGGVLVAIPAHHVIKTQQAKKVG